jgi:hypothetical protein
MISVDGRGMRLMMIDDDGGGGGGGGDEPTVGFLIEGLR